MGLGGKRGIGIKGRRKGDGRRKGRGWVKEKIERMIGGRRRRRGGGR